MFPSVDFSSTLTFEEGILISAMCQPAQFFKESKLAHLEPEIMLDLLAADILSLKEDLP